MNGCQAVDVAEFQRNVQELESKLGDVTVESTSVSSQAPVQNESSSCQRYQASASDLHLPDEVWSKVVPYLPLANKVASVSSNFREMVIRFSSMQCLLAPSLKTVRNHNEEPLRPRRISEGLRPHKVQSFNENEDDPVMTISLGRERTTESGLVYYLLAYGTRAGLIFVLRVICSEWWTMPTIEARFHHLSAITGLQFHQSETQIVSSSSDKCIRFWDIQSGATLKVFHDDFPLNAFCFLPDTPLMAYVNSQSMMKLTNYDDDRQPLQEYNLSSSGRCLKCDQIGCNIMVGCRNGSIILYGVTDQLLQVNQSVLVSKGPITSIELISVQNAKALAINDMNCSLSIWLCKYDHTRLTGLVQWRSFPIVSNVLPLKSCFVPRDGGYLVSGSENGNIQIISLLSDGTCVRDKLTYFDSPVISTAVNENSTLLAGGYGNGKVVLWRREDIEFI